MVNASSTSTLLLCYFVVLSATAAVLQHIISILSNTHTQFNNSSDRPLPHFKIPSFSHLHHLLLSLLLTSHHITFHFILKKTPIVHEDFTPMATTHLDLELGNAEIVSVSDKKNSGVSEVEVEVVVNVDLENGKDCRICHLSLDDSVEQLEFDVAIVLGCSCKDDLAAAHKRCAETWFKIKGNKTCEICGALARNVTASNDVESMEHWDESIDSSPPRQQAQNSTEIQNFWKGHRFLNFLLACMVFAFVISWLFHFNVHLHET